MKICQAEPQLIFTFNQCCGSMTLWGGSGSGSADPCLLLMDPDPGSGSCYFRHWPSRCQKKLIFNTIFSAYYFLKLHFHHFSKIKSQKESQNSKNQGFSYYFCMIIEGCGCGSRAGSGSIPLTSGSGSGSRRPKNMWIRIRIRIRNTAFKNWFFRHEACCSRLPARPGSKAVRVVFLDRYEVLDCIQCWGFVTFCCRSGSGSWSPDPYLWLIGPDPDPTPDPNITSLVLKMPPQIFFFHIFSL